MKKFNMILILMLISVLTLGCSVNTSPILPPVTLDEKPDSNKLPESNSKIVTNIHYIFGTVRSMSADTVTIEAENKKTVTFNLKDATPASLDTFTVNDIVKIYYRENLLEDGSSSIKMLRLEVVSPNIPVPTQSVIGVVIQNNTDSLILEISEGQLVSIAIDPLKFIDFPKIFAGDVIKVFYTGTIDPGNTLPIIATKIEVVKSNVLQV